MRQKAPLLKPPPLRKFHLKSAHHCMAFCFLHNDPPLTPPRCTTSWLYPRVAQISFEICTMTPPGPPPHCARSMFTHFDKILQDAQDPCSPTAQDPCSSPLRKIHAPPLRKIHVPPTTEDPCPLKHAHYILKSMEADHCRVVPTGRGKTRNTTIYHGTKYEDANWY